MTLVTGVFVTTLLSIVTIPLMVGLLKWAETITGRPMGLTPSSTGFILQTMRACSLSLRLDEGLYCKVRQLCTA